MSAGLDRAGLLRRARPAAGGRRARGAPGEAVAATPGPAFCAAIRAGASSSSTTPPRTRSSCRLATASRTRPRSSPSTTSGRDRSAATSARWWRRCGARSREGADGIAVSIIDPVAFNSLTDAALEKGIPVVSYNADGGRDNRRQAYIGQDLYQSGLKFGSRIAELVREGDVLLFIATPGQLNIQPRVDGALDAVRDSGRPIRMHVVATGADVVDERKKVEQTYRALRGARHVRGRRRLDAGRGRGDAPLWPAPQGVRAGRLRPPAGNARVGRSGPPRFLDRPAALPAGPAADPAAVPFRYSGGLVSPADTNTGLKFVTRHNVGRYLTTHSRYEGSSAKRKYPVTS